MMRLAAVPAGEPIRGIAATWDLVEADGLQLQPGAFADDVERVAAGEAIPVLWMHQPMAPAIGRVAELVEDDAGLHFSAPLNSTTLARDVSVAVEEETATDVSVACDVWLADGSDSLVERARLREISIAHTGWGADQGAGIGRAIARLGLRDASWALSLIQDLRSAADSLAALLAEDDASWDYGEPITPELSAALDEERQQLEDYIRDLFGSLPTGEE